jgi:hypothetical protein
MKKVWITPELETENITTTLGGTSTSAIEATATWCS